MNISQLIKQCDYKNHICAQQEFLMEIDSFPNKYSNFKVQTLDGEVVAGDVSKDFTLLYEKYSDNEYWYYFFCPKTMCYNEGWAVQSNTFVPVEDIIRKMELPFKVRLKLFNTWIC